MIRFSSAVASLKRGIALAAGLLIIPVSLAMMPTVYDYVDSPAEVVSDTTYSVGTFVLLYDVSCMGGICTVDGAAPSDYTLSWKPDATQLLLFTYEYGFGTALDSAVVDSIWADWGYSDPEAYAVNVPGTPPGGLYANEPAGFIQLTERGFSARGEDDWAGGDVDYDLDFSFGTVKPGPASPDSYGIARYLAGAVTGSLTPFNIYSTATTAIDEFESDSIYFAFWVKFSEDWQGHNSAVNKIMFTTIKGFASSPFILAGNVVDDGAITYQPRKQSGGTNLVGAKNYTANVGDATLTRGQWHKIENLFVLNTDTLCIEGTDCDGVVRAWVDGVLTHNFTEEDLWRSGPGYWNTVKWNPIWGGTGDSLEVEQYQHIDHIYASGSNNLPAISIGDTTGAITYWFADHYDSTADWRADLGAAAGDTSFGGIDAVGSYNANTDSLSFVDTTTAYTGLSSAVRFDWNYTGTESDCSDSLTAFVGCKARTIGFTLHNDVHTPGTTTDSMRTLWYEVSFRFSDNNLGCSYNETWGAANLPMVPGVVPDTTGWTNIDPPCAHKLVEFNPIAPWRRSMFVPGSQASANSRVVFEMFWADSISDTTGVLISNDLNNIQMFAHDMNSYLYDGEWHLLRVHMQESSDGATLDGEASVWVDDSLWFSTEREGATLRTDVDGYLARIKLGANKDHGGVGFVHTESMWWSHAIVWTDTPSWYPGD